MAAGWRRVVATIGLSILAFQTCWAGGGPENVFLVVNKNDLDSKTIANHYCKLRFIPPRNVYEIDWRGSEERTHINGLRKELLTPIFNQIDRRKLTKQIDYIIFSAGFPYAVSFTSDFRDRTLTSLQGTMGSLTGLTYLSQLVRGRDKSYIDLDDPPNHYATHQVTADATKGFRSSYAWSRSGRRSASAGHQYYLSTMLGYTAGRGNTVDEVVHYLRRSAMADGIRPQGTIYLVRNDDVRSTTRELYMGQSLPTTRFEDVAQQLNSAGVRAEIIDGFLPKGRGDVMGAVIGYSTFSWAKSGSRILPGAIVEHLTSYGGILKEGAGQTPLTEFLRYGASGSSGTVIEPRADLRKFPHPNIHCHYVRGCSLAESFYQSVKNPYQLLIVGDPLCRPWARIPVVEVDGVEAGASLTGKITITPKTRSHTRVQQYRLFVDGRLVRESAPYEGMVIDTTKLSDGYHEIRVVAIEQSPIECQGRLIIRCSVQNKKRQIVCKPFKKEIQQAERFRISVEAPGANEVLVYHRRTPLARMARSRGEVLIDSSQLGTGPVALTVVAKNGPGSANAWFADPVEINISPRSNRNQPLRTFSSDLSTNRGN